jgi:hypothetical protein
MVIGSKAHTGTAITVSRSIAFAGLMLVAGGLSACTTTEGTNAFVSADTFEHEVMTPTAQGLGLVPKDVKPDPTNRRGPLVLPKSTAVLPAPEQERTDLAALPEDSDKVTVNTAGLTPAELQQLKDARVVDTHTPDGRPLTSDELRKLTAKMKAARLATKRSIFVPPESYFATVSGGNNLVCLAKNGELVAVTDPSCPPELRSKLLKKS